MKFHSYQTYQNENDFLGGSQTLTLEIPKEISVNYSTVTELKQTLYEDLVANEFQRGHLSIRQGAALLGLTYEEFMIDFLGDRQISFINGEPDELAAEFQQEQLWLEEACGNLS